jgi:DnaK suppressor protein
MKNLVMFHHPIPDRVITKGGYMKKRDFNHLKKILTDQLDSLLKQGSATITGVISQQACFSDFIDRSSYDEARGNFLRMRDRESRLVNKIRYALECIEDGTYGVCETCGEDISLKRLEARPVTTKCIKCKMEEERLERAVA